MKAFLKSLRPLLTCAASLMFMAVSCPHYYDPFEEETSSGRDILGFYVDESPVIYRDVYITKIGEDSLEISSTFWLDHYEQLTIRFAKKDMSLDAPISNPKITLKYLYSLTNKENQHTGEMTFHPEYHKLEAESGELSFRYIGPHESIANMEVISGNFSFEGTKILISGETQKLVATGGTFDLKHVIE